MTGRSAHHLGQSTSVGSVFFWLFVLMGLLIVAGVGVLWFRRWYRSEESPEAVGFTLGDLRQLHREGQMSDDEFERAKAQIIAGTRRALERDAAEAGASEGAPPVQMDIKPPVEDDNS